MTAIHKLWRSSIYEWPRDSLSLMLNTSNETVDGLEAAIFEVDRFRVISIPSLNSFDCLWLVSIEWPCCKHVVNPMTGKFCAFQPSSDGAESANCRRTQKSNSSGSGNLSRLKSPTRSQNHLLKKDQGEARRDYQIAY